MCFVSVVSLLRCVFVNSYFTNAQKNRTISGTVYVASRRPILAGSDPPTTFGAIELNFCVRYGNRCDLNAIITTRYLIEKI